MTIDAIVSRVLQQTNRDAAPVRQRCIDAINSLLQDAAPNGRDAQEPIHALAERLDEIEIAVDKAVQA